MVGVITGDIVNSRSQGEPENWLNPLKAYFKKNIGSELGKWEVYRGDSFQVLVPPVHSLRIALEIKSLILTIDKLDARMAIGIGNTGYNGSSISESTGEGFHRSGESFEMLKTLKRELIIKTPWSEFDAEFNLILQFLQIAMESWTPVSAKTAFLVLQNPEVQQYELAQQLDISQPSISARYNRAHLSEILSLIKYFEKRVTHLYSPA